MINEEKINILNNRLMLLNSNYNNLSLIIKEKNNGELGSKEWCENATTELIDLRLQIESLEKELDLLT